MIKRVLFASAAGLALLASPPALAQETEDPMAEVFSGLGEAFAVEPLTAEQEARLPLAEGIVMKMIPDGAMAEMMGSMFDDMLDPIMQSAGEPAKIALAEKLGVTAFEITVEDAAAEEAASLFDPNWKERHDRKKAIFPEMMANMMNTMEPLMRKAMSELYAINFSNQELTEIDAFFSTETGASFARKSFTMASDPRVMSASMEALPAIMGSFVTMEQQMAESVADLPEERSYADLSDAEKARVTELTGLSQEEIEANLSFATEGWNEEEEWVEEEAG